MATATENPTLETPLPRAILCDLYSTMLHARMQAKRFRNSWRASEAVLAGTLANAEAADQFVSAGAHPVLEVLTASTKPVDTVSNTEHPGSRLIVTGVRSAAGVASGLALAANNHDSPPITVVFLPSQAARGSAWDDAAKFATTHRLPMIFVCDGLESRSPRRHDGRDMSHWPFPTIAVDGRDVIAVYRVAKEAMSAARRGRGPTLIDCVNFVAPGRRGKDQRDPLALFRSYLKRHDAWSEAWAEELESRLSREITVR